MLSSKYYFDRQESRRKAFRLSVREKRARRSAKRAFIRARSELMNFVLKQAVGGFDDSPYRDVEESLGVLSLQYRTAHARYVEICAQLSLPIEDECQRIAQ
jgi:hypothetical protein